MSGKRGLKAHAETIASDLSTATRELLMAAHRELHELARQEAIGATPEGGAGDKNAGEMRRSWVDLPGSVESAIGSLQPTKLRNVSPHGLIVDRGRRASEHAFTSTSRAGRSFSVKAGKMLGSPKAPLGVKGQVLRKLAASEDAIFERAAAAADRKVGG